MSRWPLALLLLVACTRRDPVTEPAPVRIEAEPARRLAVPDASLPAAVVESFDGGAPDVEAWSDSKDVHPSLAAFCSAFVRDVAGTRNVGGPTPSPTCKILPAPHAWRSKAPFLDARAMQKNHAYREATELLVQTKAGWRATGIEWNVLEIESASRPWVTEEPDRFEIEGSRLLAYAGGTDLWWNEAVEHEGGGVHPDDHYLRGAYGCELGASLVCWLWDPTKTTPLGRKVAPSGFEAWTTLPWQRLHDLDFAAQWPARPTP